MSVVHRQSDRFHIHSTVLTMFELTFFEYFFLLLRYSCLDCYSAVCHNYGGDCNVLAMASKRQNKDRGLY